MLNYKESSFNSQITQAKKKTRISFSILLDRVDQSLPRVKKILHRYSIKEMGSNAYEQRFQISVEKQQEAKRILAKLKTLEYLNVCYIV